MFAFLLRTIKDKEEQAWSNMKLILVKRNEVKEMKRSGVIEKSSSPWSSPVVLVKKRDGTIKFCADYKKLNDVTKTDIYTLQRIDDKFDTLTRTKRFSLLDLKSHKNFIHDSTSNCNFLSAC